MPSEQVKWELENLLAKADPELSDDAKTALIHRQFMKGLPNVLKLKLLEHNSTPNLDKMLSFVQRYRAVERFPTPMIASGYPASDNNSQLSQLLTMRVAAWYCREAIILRESSHQG